MYFYEVGVEKKAIRNQGVLTYEHPDKLDVGTIVRVSIGRNFANGLIFSQVKKPTYKTKPIDSVIQPQAVPPQLIQTGIWMEKYYASDIPSIMTMILPRGANKSRRPNKSEAIAPREKTGELTSEQKDALNKLAKAGAQTSILHGVTGSGKTRVYIELAKIQQAKSRGVLILVPEIGLTSQLVSEFMSELSEVFVVHSHLGESARHQTWQDISTAKSPIVIGARSALFSPIHSLGMIVIDEEHETSYKQDKMPRYSAVRVASYLAKMHKCQLVLGSATPSIEDYHLAKERGAPIVEMKNTVQKDASAEVEVVDLKEKGNRSNSSHIFSKQLVEATAQALSQDEQVMLFHNRRGTSTSVLCENCGWLAECPNCYLPLTHHADKHKLICHICNFNMNSPISCPECKKPELNYKGFGTKQIVEEAQKLFPQARIARFDSDVRAAEQLEKRYDELRNGDIDIVIGTQMIAKGLDLPKLNVVGVVLADTSLYLPDYSANERTFQLLQQVSGRVGRHSSTSKVIIQTYSPDHPAIVAAANRDYQAFYGNEIAQRKLINYPPFCFLLSLHVERAGSSTALKAASDLAVSISNEIKGIEVLGPTPAFRERTPNGYRWQLVIKSKDRNKLTKIVNDYLPDRWHFDLDPVNLL
jgi:primosomal protein N' (replication factor Y)